MPEYGLSLTRIFPYKDRIFDLRFCPYMGKYGSEKSRNLTYAVYFWKRIDLCQDYRPQNSKTSDNFAVMYSILSTHIRQIWPYIETSQLVFSAIQLFGFYMKGALILNELSSWRSRLTTSQWLKYKVKHFPWF